VNAKLLWRSRGGDFINKERLEYAFFTQNGPCRLTSGSPPGGHISLPPILFVGFENRKIKLMSQMTSIHQRNEIDLIELVQQLWMKKWLIIGVTAAVTLMAAAYAFLTPPVYRAQATVMPPSLSDIAWFNLARNMLAASNETSGSGSGRNSNASLKPFTTEDVYSVFTRNLQSDQSKRRFYDNVYLPSLDEDEKKGSQDSLYQSYLRRISITGPTTAQPDRFLLNIEGHDPAQAAEWAELYIRDVEQRSLQEMLENAQSEIQVQGRNLMQQIDTLRESAKVRREDRLAQLEEAFSVAQKIGLENPPMIAGQMSDQLSAIMEGNLTYMRGAKALRAEIEALKKRNSDDPFIPRLRSLQEQYSLYASLHIQPERVAVYRLDGAIETPDKPIKPMKALILLVGALVGGVFGMLIAVAAIFARRQMS